MSLRRNLTLCIAAALAAGCESGDINLQPTNVDNSTGGGGGSGGGSTENPCARYEEAGQSYQGSLDADGNCFYNSTFVSATRPIRVSSITFPNFGGYHIFDSSLYVGEDVNAIEAAGGQRIPQEGEGTRLTIEAGNTMVFTKPDSYVRIARGSQIFAEGTVDAPIVFTGDEDALLDVATENDRGLWGGIQINGNGWTNKCDDGSPTGARGGVAPNVTGPDDPDYPGGDFAPTSNNVHNCHVTAEGRPATYGGNNNTESSGVLTYVVIKYAGYEVVDGDELNALTLNAVGSGTTIDHVQVYTTQDDGFEMFGGAVNLTNIVAVNVGDDSIDYSEGYAGDIQYALVLQTSGSNRCIEADNTGSGRADDTTPTTLLRISNLTCVTSNVTQDEGTNPSSKGDAEGVLFREGAFFEMYNSIVTSNETTMQSHECFELDDTEGPQTIDAAQAGTSIASSNIIACGEALKVTADAANAAFDLGVWLEGGDGTADIPDNTNANNVVVDANLPASLLEGGVGTRAYLTLDLLTDSTGAQIFDQSDVEAPGQLFDAAVLGSIFETPAFIGAAAVGDDWTAGWTVGLTDPLVP